LTLGARAASLAVARGSASSLVRTAGSVLGSTATRSALAAGVGGSASNVMDYSFDENGNQTFGGYVATAATGFVIAGGGSLGVGRLGSGLADSVAARVPGLTSAVSRAPHAGLPENWGGVVTEQVVERFGGLAFALGNTALTPGGATSADFVSGAIEGFVGGAAGPSTGRH
jgi:hypothetical protein